MHTYQGQCHCARVRFQIQADINYVMECNCSICYKKGALYHRVSPDQFKLLSGEDALTLYQFNTKIAKHYFCRYCGIHTFHRPRSAPELYSINVRCLDNFDCKMPGIEQRTFDGKNWEQAVQALRR